LFKALIPSFATVISISPPVDENIKKSLTWESSGLPGFITLIEKVNFIN
jgi:hypothetical protein